MKLMMYLACDEGAYSTSHLVRRGEQIHLWEAAHSLEGLMEALLDWKAQTERVQLELGEDV